MKDKKISFDKRFCDVKDLEEITNNHGKNQDIKPTCVFAKRDADFFEDLNKLLTRHFEVYTRSLSCMNMKELESLKTPEETFAKHCVIYTSIQRKRYSSLVLFQAMSKNSFASMSTLEELTRSSRTGMTSLSTTTTPTIATEITGSLDVSVDTNCSQGTCGNIPSTPTLSSSSQGSNSITNSFHNGMHFSVENTERGEVTSQSPVNSTEYNKQEYILSDSMFDLRTTTLVRSQTDSQISLLVEKFSSAKSLQANSSKEINSDGECFFTGSEKIKSSLSSLGSTTQGSILTQRSFSAQTLLLRESDDSGFRCLIQESYKQKRKSLSLHSIQSHTHSAFLSVEEQKKNGSSLDEVTATTIAHSNHGNQGTLAGYNSSDLLPKITTKNLAFYISEESLTCSLDRSFDRMVRCANANLARSMSWDCISVREFEQQFAGCEFKTQSRPEVEFQVQYSYDDVKTSAFWSRPSDYSMDQAFDGEVTFTRSLSWDCISARIFEDFLVREEQEKPSGPMPAATESDKNTNVLKTPLSCTFNRSLTKKESEGDADIARSASWDCLSGAAIEKLFVGSEFDNQCPSMTHATSVSSIATLDLLFSPRQSIPTISHTTSVSSIATLDLLFSPKQNNDDAISSTSSILPRSTTMDSIASSTSLSSVEDNVAMKRSVSSLLFIPQASNLRKYKTWNDLTDEALYTDSEDGIEKISPKQKNNVQTDNISFILTDDEEDEDDLECAGDHNPVNDVPEVPKVNQTKNRSNDRDRLRSSPSENSIQQDLLAERVSLIERQLKEDFLEDITMKDDSFSDITMSALDLLPNIIRRSSKVADDSRDNISELTGGLFRTASTTSKQDGESLASTETCDDAEIGVLSKRFKILRRMKKRLGCSLRKLCCWRN